MSNDVIDQCAAKVMETCHMVLQSIGTEMNRRTPTALSIRQVAALMTIRDQQGTSLSILSGHIGCTISSASKLLDGLVERGYVVRATAEHDRRKLTLALTGEGEEALNVISNSSMSLLKEKLSVFTPNECLMVNLVMDLLRKALSTCLLNPVEKLTEKEVYKL
ncbi:MAG: MarR family winged helix-turn-helix transcriptional regulator [Armatimonadota bacterium]